jgi:hypothetical protein
MGASGRAAAAAAAAAPAAANSALASAASSTSAYYPLSRRGLRPEGAELLADERVLAFAPDRAEFRLNDCLLPPLNERAYEDWRRAKLPPSRMPCAPPECYASAKRERSGKVSIRYKLLALVPFLAGRERSRVYAHHRRESLTSVKRRGTAPTAIRSTSGALCMRDAVGPRLLTGVEVARLRGLRARRGGRALRRRSARLVRLRRELCRRRPRAARRGGRAAQAAAGRGRAAARARRGASSTRWP